MYRARCSARSPGSSHAAPDALRRIAPRARAPCCSRVKSNHGGRKPAKTKGTKSTPLIAQASTSAPGRLTRSRSADRERMFLQPARTAYCFTKFSACAANQLMAPGRSEAGGRPLDHADTTRRRTSLPLRRRYPTVQLSCHALINPHPWMDARRQNSVNAFEPERRRECPPQRVSSLNGAARSSTATPDKSRRISPLWRPLCRPLIFGSPCPPLRSEPDR